MQKPEDFMREFFSARLAEEQKYQLARTPFRRRFFAEDCFYDSHANTLTRMESEKTVKVEQEERSCKVITEQAFHYSGGVKIIGLKYHLERLGDSWLIRDVQNRCSVCEGRGDSGCPYCKGKLWLGVEIP